MKIFKRLKNLWKLSGMENVEIITTIEKNRTMGFTTDMPKTVQIIKRKSKDEIEELLQEFKEEKNG